MELGASGHNSSPRFCRGYWGIGIVHGKTEQNVGTLWRSAFCFGASFIFTVGRRYQKQASDTPKAWRHIPLINFEGVEDLKRHLPYSCQLVGVELSERARELGGYCHPEVACYLLGAEDYGLTPTELKVCHSVVQIPGASRCLNVSVAGSIVMYDRVVKGLLLEKKTA